MIKSGNGAVKAREMARLTLRLAGEYDCPEIYHRTVESSLKRLNIGMFCLEPREVGCHPFCDMRYPHIHQAR